MKSRIIITVGRQFGSGGACIARLLAQQFDCKLYDKEIFALAAGESGFCEHFFEQNDERRGFLSALFHPGIPQVGSGCMYDCDFSQDGLFKFQSEAIEKAASESDAVFVGRCADYVLRDNPDMVSIFVTADREDRIATIARRMNCDREEAEKLIRSKDGERTSYYEYYTGKCWGRADSYDLCVNSSLLGMEETADWLADFIRKRP